MSSVDILNTEFGWVNREDGTPISTTPIDFSPPPSGCFWTDLVGVSQDCDTTPPEPPADFVFTTLAGGTVKVSVNTLTPNPEPGVYSTVLQQTNNKLMMLDFQPSTDPLVGSGIFNSLRSSTMSETAVYAQTVDYSVDPNGKLLMKKIPYDDFRGNFTDYTCDVDVGAAIGFNGAQDSVIGLEFWNQEGSIFMLVYKGSTRGIQIWALYDNSDLATGWSLLGEMPAPASPGSLSDNKLYYDNQIGAVVLQNNNGRPSADNIWWAHSIGRGKPNGYNTLVTVTGGALYWNGYFRFWQKNSGETVLVGNDINDNLIQCSFDGVVAPLFNEFPVAAFTPYGFAEGGDELGSRLFIAPSTDCSGADVFAFLWREDGDRVMTDVNLAYMGCQIYASTPSLKRVIGRLTNQCI